MKLARRTTLALCIGSSALTASATASAGIAELLLKKGVITQEEYQQLKQETAAEAAATVKAAPTTASVIAATPAAAAATVTAIAPATPTVSFSKGFAVTSIDGSYTAQVGTLMQFDGAGYDDSDEIDNNSGTAMRRGRIYTQGTVLTDWQYKFELELFGTSGTEVTDAFIRYNGYKPLASSKPLAITAGHFKIPFSLEQTMSDKDLSLMERSLPNALIRSRAPGAMVSTSGDDWSAAAMAFGEQLYSNTTSPQQDEGGGASTRLTWAPLLGDSNVLHVGASAQFQEPTQRVGGSQLSYSSKPESFITGLRLINTGNISSVDDSVQYGAEIAAAVGPVTVMAEYIRSDVSRDIGNDLSFDGWYAQAAWMLTGEGRGYDVDKGVFKGIIPSHPVGTGGPSSHGTGAWELVARYSELDLNDGTISGGKENNATLGLGWYANNFVRISGNWVHVFDIDGGTYDDESLDVLQMRLQFAY